MTRLTKIDEATKQSEKQDDEADEDRQVTKRDQQGCEQWRRRSEKLTKMALTRQQAI